MILHSIQVHFDCHLEPGQVSVLVWHQLHLVESEEVMSIGHSPFVQVEDLQVLGLQMRLLQFKGDDLALLRANRDVG